MTAALSQQTIPVKDPSAVRKRRRRAPAGGAADDCFACSKKNIKCDRRRPYCSQCLEVGNECSGYKTQLTWGVGVASRGKLRGLSLPIAKAPPVTREPVKKTANARSRSSSSTTQQWPEQDDARRTPRGPIDIPVVTQAASAPTTPYPLAGYDYLSMSQPENTPPMPQGSWGSIAYSPGVANSPNGIPKYPKFQLPLVTEGLSSSVDSLSELDYMSPMSQSYSREDIPFVNSPNLMYENYAPSHSSPGPQSPPTSLYVDHQRTAAPTSCPSLVYAPSEACSSIHMDPYETQQNQKLAREYDALSVPEADAYSTSCNSTTPSWASPNPREEDLKSQHSEYAPSHWPTVSEAQAIHVSQDLTSKMPFFMDYYENFMCPSMVFIDGPHNPFRNHVLQLAANSRSLQHAICALAACNLRMKRKLSLGRDTQELSERFLQEKQAAEAVASGQMDDQSLAEEYEHRNLAVQLLNQQLNDPSKSTHDSVLATILLLCHYRMVESGIAKFHTQFAGVNKILALRAQQGYAQPGDSAWMEAIFTYFDAISASINDREAQVNNTFMSMNPDALLPVGAENLVGCDRELFKTIRKLGMLNLLSQNRPVENIVTSPTPQNMAIRSHSPFSSPLGHVYRDSINMGDMAGQQIPDMYSVSSQRFEGNGYGSTLDDQQLLTSAIYSSATFEDSRSKFWHEWKEARLALQNWQFDATRVAASLPGTPSPSQLRDLGALSEAFRYAALLYTERLISPSIPSSHTSLQNLVSQVVYYANTLESGSSAEKFLLWPLFVAGSECVNELQQNIVRTKCRDIMSRSGYMNNLAALEVLEKLWANGWTSQSQEGGAGGSPGSKRHGPFNWTQCIGGPGVEVEWIMF